MNICVCLRQVPDTGANIELLKQKEGIDESNLDWIINPYDEFAIEEALRIVEKKRQGEVHLLSVGTKRVEKALKTALAMGADQASLIETDQRVDPSLRALAFSSFIKQKASQKAFDLILLGRVSVDENHCATGPMLAEHLDLLHVGFVTRMEEVKEGEWILQRTLSTNTKQELCLSLPALITVEKGINQARFPSLPGIMKAKKKTIEKIQLKDLGLESVTSKIFFHSYEKLNRKLKPHQIEGSPENQAKELVRLLREKERVL